ncbi:MAG: sigma-70 family RNA polymerase sigma factor [Acidobacteriota bacterium]
MVQALNFEEDSRDELIERYLPYVRSIAQSIVSKLPAQIDINDLIGYGRIGLIEAVERFDRTRGVSFKTFAYYRIKGAIYDGLRQIGWFSRSEFARIRFEQNATELMNSYSDANSEMRSQPVEDEIHEVEAIFSGIVSAYMLSLESSETLNTPENRAAPDEDYAAKEFRQIIRQAISQLPETERKLIEYYYYHGLTLEEIGNKLGLSKSWASRLHSKCLQHLCQMLKAKGIVGAT